MVGYTLLYTVVMPLTQQILEKLYVHQKLSVAQISQLTGETQGKVNYWLRKFGIAKRTISDATYTRYNPDGDPFLQTKPIRMNADFLAGVGLGLYWGEGTKRNKTSVRLGNTDPDLIRAFLLFLTKVYQIDTSRLRFGLQIFSDMNIRKEEKFWRTLLQADEAQFHKTIVTLSGSIGTYREKSPHGVLTIYFSNRKLRDLLVAEIDRLRKVR